MVTVEVIVETTVVIAVLVTKTVSVEHGSAAADVVVVGAAVDVNVVVGSGAAVDVDVVVGSGVITITIIIIIIFKNNNNNKKRYDNQII